MTAPDRLCECGCGEPVAKRFKAGHALRLPEYKTRLREARAALDMESVKGTRARNAEIRSAMAAGETFGDVAIKYGITRQRVEQIYRKQRSAARDTARSALLRGEIVRPVACESCGDDGVPIEAHHPDYAKPLLVQWLCRLCHAREDALQRQQRGEPRRKGDGPLLRMRRVKTEQRRRQKAEARRSREQHRLDIITERRADMLYQLAATALRIGHTPSNADIAKRVSWCYVRYYHEFGSLTNACHIVGLTPNGVGQGRRKGYAPAPIPPNFSRVVDQLRGELSCAA